MRTHSKIGRKGISRRDFMKIVAATSVATALPARSARAELPLPGWGDDTSVSLAGVAKGSSEDALVEAVRVAAETATDFSWLSKGDSVLIKPVLNSGNPYPATTSPTGIRAMVALLKEKGAGRVIVSDMSGIEHVRLTPDKLTGSSRELMKNSGMAKAVEESGAEFYFPEEEGWDAFFEDGPASGSNWKAGITMPKIIKEVDHLVLMPRCSRHLLAGSTLGMKAAVGYWRTDSRLEYHHDAKTFQEKTAEANTVSSLLEKQRLVLTTATQALATSGPDEGYITEPDNGLVFGSESIVAHDMISLAWLLENRKLAPAAEKKGSKDPNNSQMIVGIANRVVVKWLGGIGAALSTQKLTRNDIDTIWDDRVLNRAYWLWKGVPRVKLVDANDKFPIDIKRKLAEAVLADKHKT
jgi:uncharacterized protein (DUF362 family)